MTTAVCEAPTTTKAPKSITSWFSPNRDCSVERAQRLTELLVDFVTKDLLRCHLRKVQGWKVCYNVSKFSELMGEVTISGSEEPCTSEQEIELYKAEQKQAIGVDPIHWWRGNMLPGSQVWLFSPGFTCKYRSHRSVRRNYSVVLGISTLTGACLWKRKLHMLSCFSITTTGMHERSTIFASVRIVCFYLAT